MVEMTAVKRATTVNPTISVLICAYTEQRWDTLLAACGEVGRQLTPDDELIVVIDHNDELYAKANRFLRFLTGARVLKSAGSNGLSGARNTGVSASRCDVVAFLDDDAQPRSDWLAKLRSAFCDDSALVVGTGVEPRWAGGRAPRWFPPEFGWVVGCGYAGLPTSRARIRNPIGASMAIHRSAFEVAGGFSEAMGRVGTLPKGCEETEFCIRLARTEPSATVVHEPSSVVDHVVPGNRQTVRYFVSRCFHEGRSKRDVAKLSGTHDALSSERRYVRRLLPMAVLRDIGAGLRWLDPFAYARAAMVALGLATTVVGFLFETIHPERQLSAPRWS